MLLLLPRWHLRPSVKTKTTIIVLFSFLLLPFWSGAGWTLTPRRGSRASSLQADPFLLRNNLMSPAHILSWVITAAETLHTPSWMGLNKTIKRGEVPSQMSSQQENSTQVPSLRPVQWVNYDKVPEGSSHRFERYTSRFHVPFQAWRLLFLTGNHCKVPFRVLSPRILKVTLNTPTQSRYYVQ